MDALWPVMTIRVRSQRIELATPSETDLAELSQLAARGIYDPLNLYIPRSPVAGWNDLASPAAERAFLQYYWASLADCKPEKWTLLLAARVNDTVIGVQEIGAKDYSITRTVSTGSWLGQQYQGQGHGKEMRLAILHLAFSGLGAHFAESAAWESNAPSLAVSRSLGYIENGVTIRAFNQRQHKQVNLVLSRNRFQPGHVRFEIDGLTQDTLEFMGA